MSTVAPPPHYLRGYVLGHRKPITNRLAEYCAPAIYGHLCLMTELPALMQDLLESGVIHQMCIRYTELAEHLAGCGLIHTTNGTVH